MPIAAIAGTAKMKSDAANSAARSAQQAKDQNLAFNRNIYDTAQQNFNPYIQSGGQANDELAGLLGIGGDPNASQAAFNKYLDSTNYKFQLDQGLNGTKTANAPAFGSGATLKALNNYAQGQAGSALAGYESLLSGQQGLGLGASSALAGVGTNIAGQNASAVNSAASAQGNAAIAGANAWGNGISQFENAARQAVTQSSFGG